MDTKENLFRDFKSFHDKLEWFALGPIDVHVFGNVAVAHGSVSERRSRDGKDTRGEFAWEDLLEKRDGKWVVLRSAGAKVVWPTRPRGNPKIRPLSRPSSNSNGIWGMQWWPPTSISSIRS